MKRTLFIAAAALAATFASAAYAQPAGKNITIDATPTTVKFGRTATLSGKLTGQNNDNKPVVVQEDPFPVDTFGGNAGTATTNASGDWSLIVKPELNTRYMARSGNADSRTVDVLVRPAISLTLSDRTPKLGTKVTFSGRLCPEHDGVRVALQRRVAPNQWRTLRNPLLKDAPGTECSTYSRGVRPRRDGAFRILFRGDADHAEGPSRTRRVDVHR